MGTTTESGEESRRPPPAECRQCGHRMAEEDKYWYFGSLPWAFCSQQCTEDYLDAE